MGFRAGFGVGDIVNALVFGSAVVGLFLTWVQIRRNALTQKAIFFKDLYGSIHADPAMSKAFLKIEYSEFRYGPEFHHSEEEVEIDKLLHHCDLICALHLRKLISDKEMSYFEYDFRRIYTNREIRSYFEFLDEFLERLGVKTRSFDSFQAYCEREHY